MRRLARASEVAQAVLFLLGPESSYITVSPPPHGAMMVCTALN